MTVAEGLDRSGGAPSTDGSASGAGVVRASVQFFLFGPIVVRTAVALAGCCRLPESQGEAGVRAARVCRGRLVVEGPADRRGVGRQAAPQPERGDRPHDLDVAQHAGRRRRFAADRHRARPISDRSHRGRDRSRAVRRTGRPVVRAVAGGTAPSVVGGRQPRARHGVGGRDVRAMGRGVPRTVPPAGAAGVARSRQERARRTTTRSSRSAWRSAPERSRRWCSRRHTRSASPP